MSTAQPLKDGESYYPVIQQGAGLANVGSAISASSYVLVDGQPDGKVKAELGDDPDRTGAYQVSFTLNNLTKESQNYLLSAELFTQAVEEGYKTPNDEYWAGTRRSMKQPSCSASTLPVCRPMWLGHQW